MTWQRIGCVLLLLVGSCRDPAQVLRDVYAFMECEECTDGELIALTRHGDAATPILSEFLNQGPPVDRRNLKRNALLVWQREVQHDSSDVLKPAGQRMLDNYTVRYKRRSKFALGAINTPAALAALCAAQAGPC